MAVLLLKSCNHVSTTLIVILWKSFKILSDFLMHSPGLLNDKRNFLLNFFLGGEIITNLIKTLICWIGFSNITFYSLNREGG